MAPAVRGITAEVSITVVGECTEAIGGGKGAVRLSGKMGPFAPEKWSIFEPEVHSRRARPRFASERASMAEQRMRRTA